MQEGTDRSSCHQQSPIYIPSGATGEQADITFLCLVTILDHQMAGKINPHCREWFHLVEAKVRQGG